MNHPIDLFLATWAARGGSDGADLRLRVYRALSLPARWDRQRLRSTLQSLLALEEEQWELFAREFDTFFPDYDLPSWLTRRLAGEQVQGEQWNSGRALKVLCDAAQQASVQSLPTSRIQTVRQLRIWRPHIVAAGMKLKKGWEHLSDGIKWAISIIVLGGMILGTGTLAVQTLLFSPKQHLSWPEKLQALLRLVLSMTGLLMVGLISTYSLIFMRGKLLRLRQGGIGACRTSPAQRSLDAEPDFRSHELPHPFTEQDLDRLAYCVGHSVSEEHFEVDLRTTVYTTVRQGGLLEVILRPQRRVSHILLVRPAFLDSVSETLVERLVTGLNRRGVLVKIHFGPPVDEWPDLVLVLIDLSRQAALSDPPLARWVRAPRMSIIDIREPALWGEEVTRLAKPVFNLTYSGLFAALRGETRLPLDHTRSPQRVCAERRLAEVLPLAAACALAEPCDLGTIDQLRRRFAPHLSFLQIQHIVSAEGVTADPCGLCFSSSLMHWLRERVGTHFQLAVLRWQAERLSRIESPMGSRARKVLSREKALVGLQIMILEAGDSPIETAKLTHTMALLLGDLISEKERRRTRERLQEVKESLPAKSPNLALLQARIDSYWGQGQRRPVLVHISPGQFIMGDGASSDPVALPHSVVISRPFALSVTPITRQQYAQVTGKNPSHYQGNQDLPVESVSWLDAIRFCNKLSALDGFAPYYKIVETEVQLLGGSGYRLPTEAEWEYAARAGQTTMYSGSDDPDLVGWYSGNSEGIPHPVGQKAPNVWGLHDMSGNVREWVWDTYALYDVTEQTDPLSTIFPAKFRIYRGGSFNLNNHRMAVAHRMWNVPSLREPSVGFRIARSIQ